MLVSSSTRSELSSLNNGMDAEVLGLYLFSISSIFMKVTILSLNYPSRLTFLKESKEDYLLLFPWDLSRILVSETDFSEIFFIELLFRHILKVFPSVKHLTLEKRREVSIVTYLRTSFWSTLSFINSFFFFRGDSTVDFLVEIVCWQMKWERFGSIFSLSSLEISVFFLLVELANNYVRIEMFLRMLISWTILLCSSDLGVMMR